MFREMFRSKMADGRADGTGKLGTRKGRTAAKHVHYLYCLRYNEISKKTMEVEKCPGTKTLSSGVGLVYQSKGYCIEIVQTKNITKKASDVRKEKLSRYGDLLLDFFPDMKNVDQTGGGFQKYENRFVEEKDVAMALSMDVVPKRVVEACHDELKSSLFKRTLLTVDGKVCLPIIDVETMITEFKHDLFATVRSVKEELPLNRWLYEYLHQKLNPSVFVTEYREENIRGFPDLNVAEVNEYATSKADLVVYKRLGEQFSTLKCCFISVSQIPDLCEMVTELKMSDQTSYPIWECFHNMSAVGANIGLKALSMGKLINQVLVYGIVTTIDDTSSARLIQLWMNFDENKCIFLECDGKFPLAMVLNSTLSHI